MSETQEVETYEQKYNELYSHLISHGIRRYNDRSHDSYHANFDSESAQFLADRFARFYINNNGKKLVNFLVKCPKSKVNMSVREMIIETIGDLIENIKVDLDERLIRYEHVISSLHTRKINFKELIFELSQKKYFENLFRVTGTSKVLKILNKHKIYLSVAKYNFLLNYLEIRKEDCAEILKKYKKELSRDLSFKEFTDLLLSIDLKLEKELEIYLPAELVNIIFRYRS